METIRCIVTVVRSALTTMIPFSLGVIVSAGFFMGSVFLGAQIEQQIAWAEDPNHLLVLLQGISVLPGLFVMHKALEWDLLGRADHG